MDYVPVLNKLSIFKAKDIDDGIAILAEKTGVMAMEENVVPVSEHPLYFTTSGWVVFGDPLHILAQAIEAIGCKGRVLRIGTPAGRLNPEDMIAKMVEIIPASEGKFRNIHPAFVQDALKVHQAEMFERPI